jgi:arylsulfatase A-like enzyme
MRWPGHIPAGTESKQMVMNIDLFPTIAKVVDAQLPTHPIDGLDVWPIIAGRPFAKNPHHAYWFYYEANQLQSVVSGDGRWKLQLPHTYRTLNGREGHNDGTPIPYDQTKLDAPELYDLVKDIGEMRDLSAKNPDKVRALMAVAEDARRELGDSLTGRKGSGNRPPGKLE